MSPIIPPPVNSFKVLSEVINFVAKEQINYVERGSSRIVELAVWLAIAAIPSSLFLHPDFSNLANFTKSLSERPVLATIISVIVIIPFCSLLIFGGMPFELQRTRFKSARRTLDAVRQMPQSGIADAERRLNLFSTLPAPAISSIESSRNFDPRELLAFYAYESSKTAADVYRRSSIYLFVGVIISFSGLLFLYIRTTDLPTTTDLLGWIISITPTIGVLFFLELVAFFFLRQHRVAMDEFRYFEQVKRNREENLIILKMYAENASVISTKEVLEAMSFYSSPKFMNKGDTTELLENRKLLKDELVIFERLVNAATAFRNNEKIEGSKK